MHFRAHVMLLVLGTDAKGRKHVLVMRSSSWDAGVVHALLAELIERGVRANWHG